MIVSLGALGRVLRPTLPSPTAVAALLGNHQAELAFRQIVREVLPERAEEIMHARQAGGTRENARVWAFLQRIEEGYFPVYECEEYEQVACGILFVRLGWGYERVHELDMRPGEILLFALCAQPFAPGFDSRIPLLDACETHVPSTLLHDIPQGGLSPAQLHEQLDNTPYAAAAFADWVWRETGTVFLDFDDDIEVVDADWTRKTVLELAEQWQRAEAILNRIDALASWLEANPPKRFSRLVDAALGRDAHLDYQRMRRLYAYEITEAGVVPIDHTGDTVALPLDTAS